MIRRSKFRYPASAPTAEFETTISVEPWIPGNATIGGRAVARSGVPAAYIVRRDKLLKVTVRIREDQWDDLEALVEFGQTGQPIEWLPEATDDLTTLQVYLEHPAAGEAFEPTREGELTRILDFSLELRSVDGTTLWSPYFDPSLTPSVPTADEDNAVGMRFNDLLDVDADAPADGDVPVYHLATRRWRTGVGNGFGQVIPASRFGALANGTDQWERLQEWAEYPYEHPENPVRSLYLDAAGVAGTADLFGNLGQGIGYVHDKPIVFPSRVGLRLLGSRQNRRENYGPGSRLWPSFAHGWPAVIDDGQRQPDLVPSILGGPGVALRRKNTYTNETLQYIRLRDAATMELDGLSTLVVEYYYRYDGGTPDGWIVSSFGRRFAHELTDPIDNTNGAFIASFVSGFPSFDLQTTAGHCALHPSAGFVLDGGPHHVVFQWTAGHACLRVDGLVTAEQDHGGTLLQDPGEEVNFGVQYAIQPSILALQTSPMGVFESMRISDAARYPTSGDISPPAARFVSDATTLALLNFDDHNRCALKVDTRDGAFWAYLQGIGDPGGVDDEAAYLFSLGGLEVDGISIDGDINPAPYGGARTTKTCGLLISAPGMYGVDLSHLSLARMRCGLRLGGVGNAYDLSARRIHVNTGWGTTGRYGAESPNLTGLARWEQCWMQGGQIPFILGTGAVAIDGLHIEADQRSIFSMLVRADDVVASIVDLARVTFSVEGGVSAAYRANLGVDGSNAGVVVRGSASFQSNNSDAWDPPMEDPHVPLFVAGVAQVHLDAPTFAESGGVGSVLMDELVRVAPDFVGRVSLRNPKYALTSPYPPSSLTRGAVTVVVDGTAIVPYAATPELDAATASTFELTLTGGCAPTIINLGHGQRVRFRVVQNGAGGHAFTWPGNVLGADAVDVTGDAVTQQEFEYDGTALRALAPAAVS